MLWTPLVCILFLTIISSEAFEFDKKSKAPRLFWTTTTQTYTSKTLSTTTWCFRSSNTLATTGCGKRRKRRVIIDEIVDRDDGLNISPTNLDEPDTKDELMNSEDSIDTIQDTIDEEAEREARFLQFYFYTTTLTSTTTVATSYTSTSTVASLICTPSGFFLSVC